MISHHHKCVFVHIPKNAGQSVEHVFLNLLGLDWSTRAPLLLTYNDNPELGPPRLAHLKAKEYVKYKYLTQEMFDTYFKFAFVRNPWSRTVSMYKYLGYKKRVPFKSFLFDELKDRLFEEQRWFVGPQSDFIYSEDGSPLVDYIGHFEELQSGFDFVCKQIGLAPTKLPHVNESESNRDVVKSKPKAMVKNLVRDLRTRNIPSHKNWRDYYDKESIDCVAALYERDIELLGYDFD